MANNDISCKIEADGIHKQWIIKGRNGTWQCDTWQVTRNGNSFNGYERLNEYVKMAVMRGVFNGVACSTGGCSFSGGFLECSWTVNGDLVVSKLKDSKDLYYKAVANLPVADQQDEKAVDEARKAAEAAREKAEEARAKAKAEAAELARLQKLSWEDWKTNQAKRQESGESTPKAPYVSNGVLVIEEDGVFSVQFLGVHLSITKRGDRGEAISGRNKATTQGGGMAGLWINGIGNVTVTFNRQGHMTLKEGFGF
jgi:hypothetical protein